MPKTPSTRSSHLPRTWSSWAVLALLGWVVGMALVQVFGRDVSAATLVNEPIERPDQRPLAPLPEVVEPVPFL